MMTRKVKQATDKPRRRVLRTGVLGLLAALMLLPAPEADARRMNEAIEAAVRDIPEQYFWVHRRFKTRPPGEPDFYQK